MGIPLFELQCVADVEHRKILTVIASRTFSLARALLKACIMADNVLGVQMQFSNNVTMTNAEG